MNLTDPQHASSAVVRDMLETPDVIAGFAADQAKDTGRAIAQAGRLLLTGEGSSRIFPAKNLIAAARHMNWPVSLCTEGARQAQEYDLSNWAVFAASHSGETPEVVKLFRDLKSREHKHLYALTGSDDGALEELANKRYALKCGPERAPAATKSVVEQGLFYHAMLEHACGIPLLGRRCKLLAEQVRSALTMPINPALIDTIARANTIYFAGRNDGVGEELALKAKHITRKKSGFLEGTYAIHGAEEVLSAQDVVIWIDPWEDTVPRFQQVLVEGAGVTVIAVATKPTIFPTIVVPESDLQSYVMLTAGWNILVEVAAKSKAG